MNIPLVSRCFATIATWLKVYIKHVHTKMQLEQQVCSLELAKRLRELGVKQESYFYWFFEEYNHEPVGWRIQTEEGDYSAFTVAELGEMLANANQGFMPSANSNFDRGWYYNFMD